MDANGTARTLTAQEMDFAYRQTSLNGAIICGATLKLMRDDPNKVRERLMEIWNDKRRSQPFDDASAGCIFKNPPGQSAGELIERAGLKGKFVGGATVSTQHANFIIAQEGATAKDVLRLIRIVRREVAERFGVELELEIEIWGCTGARTAELVA
jgi:UDP-N-acetylmuramate dehydrogenase